MSSTDIEIEIEAGLFEKLAAVTKERDDARETLEAWRFHSEAWGTDPDAVRHHIIGITRRLAAEREKVEKLREAAALTLAQFASVNMTLDAVRKAFVQAAPKEDGE